MGIVASDSRWAVRILLQEPRAVSLSYVPLTTIVLVAKRDKLSKVVVRLRYWDQESKMVAEYKRSVEVPVGIPTVSIKHQSKISYSLPVPRSIWYTIIRPFFECYLRCRAKDKVRTTFFRGRARITLDHKPHGGACMEIKIPVM